jgi:hypothetical protein
MDTHYPTIDQPATQDYVLAIFNEINRQQLCECWGSPELDEFLSFDSTVQDLVEAFEWFEWPGWPGLGRVCNHVFGIECSDADWKAVLEPADKKRLAGVCDLIARHARRQVIRPARLLGCACASAGAFLTIRSLLQEAGADAAEIAPSTLLAPYTCQYVMQFMGPISWLAPGALPMARIRQPLYDVGLLGCPVGFAILLIGICSDLHLLAAAGGLICIEGYALSWIAARCQLPSRVDFGELRTFRDLAVALAEGGHAGSGTL